jgi:hypothetical protein
MAVLSSADIQRVARIFARRVYGSVVGSCHHSDIVAAVTAMDNAFEGTVSALPGTSGQSVINRLNQVFSIPFSNASASDKGTLLAIWAGVKYGFSFQSTEGL